MQITYLINIMKEKILKLNDIKSTNLQAVLDILLQSNGLSRVELARRIGCDNTTVTRAVSALIEHGIVVQGEKTEQALGRPRVILRINPDGPLLLGLSLESERITGVLTDLRGIPQKHYQIDFRRLPSKMTFLNAVTNVIHHLKDIAKDRLCGIGAAVFGIYSGDDFKLENAAALPALNGLELRPFFEKAADSKVTICDHLVAKMSYFSRKLAQLNSGTVMLVSAGSGIGSLMAEDGRLIFSRNNHGGELGHTICQPNGILCSCGRHGCLETVASIPALLHKCCDKLSMPQLDFDHVCQLYQSCDKTICSEVKTVVDFLGISIANLLNNNPVEQLIVTGSILKLGENFQSLLEAKINSILFASVKNGMTTHFLQPDQEDSLACGAAVFAERNTDII
ncbi:MAG: ROK family transcriptional regulator [Victivallales bacterium]|nr:ROK family transcriptional regulator [Victivallales bacterium]